MKKSLILLGFVLLYEGSYAQCCSDTISLGAPVYYPTFTFPNYPQTLPFCREYPTDTVRHGDPHFAMVSPFSVSSLYPGVMLTQLGVCAVPVPKNDTLYGVGFVGYFTCKNTDSIRIPIVVCRRVGNTMDIIDSVDFDSYYNVRSFEYYETNDTSGKIDYYYPYLYEFYFDNPVVATDDTLYIGVPYLRVPQDVASRLSFGTDTLFRLRLSHCMVVFKGRNTAGTSSGSVMWTYDPLWCQWVRGDGYRTEWAGYFAILGPDEPHCPAPDSPWANLSDDGQLTLAWNHTAYDSVQIVLASAGTSENPSFTSITRTLPASDTATAFSNLPDGIYTARLRATCHHNCPNHDTIVWSNWSAPTTITLVDTNLAIPSVNHPSAALHAHPNPTIGQLSVTVPQSLVGTSLELLDLDGRLLEHFKIHNVKFEIDLRHLPAGTYLLRAAEYTQRVVKH